jgi:ABC-type phosphate/phosphonate transport system substrate-binding protein
MAKHDPDSLAGTRILTETDAAPALPYVTGTGTSSEDHKRLRGALTRALADPDLTVARQALLIKGFADLQLDDYGVMLRMEEDAAAAGYGALN